MRSGFSTWTAIACAARATLRQSAGGRAKRARAVILEWRSGSSILPRERLWIELRILEATRRNFVFDGIGGRYEAIDQPLSRTAFGI
jgi:hypothetical protein